MLPVADGQALSASFHPTVTDCFLNVYKPGDRPGKNPPLLNGAKQGNWWSGTMEGDGNATLIVYLTINDPSHDKTCNFAIKLATGEAAGEAGAAETPP